MNIPWTEARFLEEYYKHPILKDVEIVKGFKSTKEHIIVKGSVTNHFFNPKCINKVVSLSLRNSTDKRAYKIHQFNTIHNNLYTYDNYELVKTSEDMKFTCQVHGEMSMSQSRHMKGFGCKECSTKGAPKMTQEGFELMIKDCLPANFEIIGEYEGYHTPILCRDKYGLVKVAPGNMRQDGCGSIRTAVDKNSYKENQLKEIHNNLYSYPDFKYINNHSVISIKCKIHGIFTQKSYVHQMGCGCKRCSDEAYKGGYLKSDFIKVCNKNNEGRGLLYIIKCWGEEEIFYKIGITSRSVKRRFKCRKDMPYNFKDVFIIEGSAKKIYELENKLHSKHKSLRHTPSIPFAGQTECFNTLLPVDDIKESLASITEQLYIIEH